VKTDREGSPDAGVDSATIRGLVEAAQEVRERAYAPYSKFRVGAAVLANDDGVYTGCNVENASYGVTICAERSALFAAVAGLGQSLQVRAVVIVGPSGQAAPPCGACRQVLAELAPDAIILFSSPEGFERRTVPELIPDAFDLPR
jgi:cytidine deaminase